MQLMHPGIAPLLLAMHLGICSPFASNAPWHCSPSASNAHWNCSPLLATHPGIAPLSLAMLTWQCSPFASSALPGNALLFFFCLPTLHWHCSPFLAMLPPRHHSPLLTVSIAPLAVPPSLSVMLCQPVSLAILQQHSRMLPFLHWQQHLSLAFTDKAVFLFQPARLLFFPTAIPT